MQISAFHQIALYSYFIAFNRKCYQLPHSTLEVWNKYEPRSPSALYFVDSVSGGVFMQCLEIVRCPAGLWWWWASHHKMLVSSPHEVIVKRVKTILLAGSDESTTIQQLWTSTKCNKNALTSQQSEHFWLLCNMLGCSVQDILAPDISHSRLSKVDGMGYGYSSHHLCGKVHRHDQQSIVSYKLPRLSLSWVIRSFFSSSL